MKEVTVTVKLLVPDSFKPTAGWSAEQCIEDYVSHWLEEGYFVDDHAVCLPRGIEYNGFDIQF